MRIISSQSAASGPRRSSGRSLRSRAAARHLEQADRAVGALDGEAAFGERDVGRHRPPAHGRRSWSPSAMTASDALPMTTPPMRIERAECEPPPTGTMSVSPWISRMPSTSTPSHSPTHCAKLVSWPWPLDSVPIDDVDAAFRLHVDLGAFARRAAGRSRVVGKPDAAQLAVAACFAAALVEALPVGERQRPVHHLGVVAAVVGHAERVGVGLRRRRDRGCAGAARCGRSRTAAPRCRSAARSRTSPPAGRRCDRGWSAPCCSAPRGRGNAPPARDRPTSAARAFHQRHVHHAVRADVADDRAAQREEPAAVVERELRPGSPGRGPGSR